MMRLSQTSQFIYAVALMMTCVLHGCGGGEEPAKPVAAPPPTAAQAAVQIAKPKPKKKKTTAPKRVTKTKETVDPNSMDVNQPNFQKTDEVVATSENQVYDITPPQITNISNSFTIVQNPAATAKLRTATPSLPENFVELPSFGFSNYGYPNRIRCTIDDSEMVFVPGGVCIVGVDEQGTKYGPQFSCYVEPYYIDITEVTLEQYEAHRAKLKRRQKSVLFRHH